MRRDGLVIAHAANQWPDASFLIAPSCTRTFKQAAEEADRVARAIHALGLPSRSRIAFDADGSPELILAMLGCWAAGHTAVMLNRRLPQAARSEAAARVGCTAYVADDDRNGSIPLANLFAQAPTDADRSPLDPSDPAVIVFTSGSTSTPKAAVLTLANLIANARASNRMLPFEPGRRWLMSLPLFHVSGLGVLFRALAGGGAVVVPPAECPMAKAVHDYSVTHVSLVATQLQRMIQDSEGAAALRKLDAILLGGSAIPATLLHASHQAGLKVHKTYGMTETASQIATSRSDASLDDLLNGAPPILPDSVRVSPSGEIEVRGATLFAGYWEDDRITLPVDDEGWFATGDLGSIDDRGYLTVTGRRDNMFISGGENIQPEEIEARLMQLPGIHQAFVVPMADAEFGQRPVAFVDAQELFTEEWMKALRDTLPGYKIPVRFDRIPEACRVGLKVSRSLLIRLLNQ